MMKASLLLLVALSCTVVPACFAANDFEAFRSFMHRFSKQYETDTEWNKRFSIFKANMALIADLNEQNGSPAFGVTKFSDLEPSEFKRMYLNYKPAQHQHPDGDVYAFQNTELPTSVDWRKKGAFSTTEEIESRWAQAGHGLIELSVQQIVSCDNVDQGCNGGDTVTAYQYVEKAGGLELASKYPYTSGSGNSGRCKFKRSDVVANITGYKWATKNSDEKVMQEAIATIGPLSTCVDATTWQFYSGGVIKSNCGRQLDHCVQTVGYTTKDGVDVWTVRNSWGADWGYSGYLYIEIGKDLCGIADEPTYALCE